MLNTLARTVGALGLLTTTACGVLHDTSPRESRLDIDVAITVCSAGTCLRAPAPNAKVLITSLDHRPIASARTDDRGTVVVHTARRGQALVWARWGSERSGTTQLVLDPGSNSSLSVMLPRMAHVETARSEPRRPTH